MARMDPFYLTGSLRLYYRCSQQSPNLPSVIHRVTCAFRLIARPTKNLQVLTAVTATKHQWNNMVNMNLDLRQTDAAIGALIALHFADLAKILDGMHATRSQLPSPPSSFI